MNTIAELFFNAMTWLNTGQNSLIALTVVLAIGLGIFTYKMIESMRG